MDVWAFSELFVELFSAPDPTIEQKIKLVGEAKADQEEQDRQGET